MEGFKKWVEEQQELDHPVTVDLHREKDQTPMPIGVASGIVSAPAASPPERTEIRPTQVHREPLAFRLVHLLGEIDPALTQRRADGKSLANFEGSPQYTSPEEADKVAKNVYHYEMDYVEELLMGCAELFPRFVKPCKRVLELWVKFRSLLHFNEGRQYAHPVLYQVEIMRLKNCEKHFPAVDDEVHSDNMDRDTVLIKAWESFYAAWNGLTPAVKRYLTKFEKHSSRSHIKRYLRDRDAA